MPERLSTIRSRRPRIAQIWDVVLTGGVVALASLLGIAARHAGSLSSFYPANAVLVGTLVAVPRLRRLPPVVGAVGGYLFADLVTGSSLTVTVWLTVANLVGVVVAAGLLCRFQTTERWLGRPASMAIVAAACLAGAGAAAVPGTHAGVTYFGLDTLSAALTWFAAEAAMYFALLPAFLVARHPLASVARTIRDLRTGTKCEVVLWCAGAIAPLVVLAASLTLGSLVDNGIGLAFALPALLWSAMRGRIFESIIGVVMTNVWYLLGFGLHTYDQTIQIQGAEVASGVTVQLSMAVLSLAVLFVAVSSHQQAERIEEMGYLASSDSLTGLRNRRAVLADGQVLVDEMLTAGSGVAVLMLDLDNFKTINDHHGHAVGDRMLVAIADALRGRLRDRDVLGRLGGEEFVAVLGGISPSSAAGLGESLRQTVADVQIVGASSVPITVTVSIGLAHVGVCAGGARRPNLLDLLEQADAALYAAKRLGRDRLVVSPGPPG